MKRASFSTPTNAILEIKTILNLLGKAISSFPDKLLTLSILYHSASAIWISIARVTVHNFSSKPGHFQA